MKSLKPVFALLFILALQTALLAEAFSGSGVSLETPDGWTKGPSAGGVAIVAIAPDPLPNFRPNVNVMLQKTGAADYDTYKAVTQKEVDAVKGQLTGYQKFTFADGSVGRRMVLSFKQNGRDIKTLSVWRMKDGITYLISCTTVKSDFESRLPVFNDICKTLKI